MFKALLFSSVALAAAAPALASAQEAPESAAARPQALDEVVVTARRRAEDISKVPVSVSAFSGKTLERKGVLNLQDVAKLTPGLLISPVTRTNSFIAIRGQSKAVTGNINPGVIVYTNEVPLNNASAIIQNFDTQNIQVLKGPQGTLFGRNAMGGAILVYSNQPSQTFGGYAKVDLGSYDFRQFEGAVNVPIVPDKVAVRLATQLFHAGSSFDASYAPPYFVSPAGVLTPGQVQPLSWKPDEYRGKSFRVSLLVEPTDNFKNVTIYDRQDLRGANNVHGQTYYPNGYGGAPPATVFLPPATLVARLGPGTAQNIINTFQCGTSVNCDYRLAMNYHAQAGRQEIVNVDPGKNRSILWGVTNITTWDLNDQTTLKNIFGYRDADVFTTVDNDGLAVPLAESSTTNRLRQYTEELQLAGNLFDGRLKYTLGGFYYNEAPDGPGGNSSVEFNSSAGLAHTIPYTYLHNKSKAIYGQIDYSLDDFVKGLTLTAGLRKTWDTVSGCAGSVVLLPTAAPLVNPDRHGRYIPSEDMCTANSVNVAAIPGARSALSQNFPKKAFDKLTYTLGANWQITPGIMVYGTHRRGYRAGSYNTPLFDQAYLGEIQAFGPETLTDWEVGTKVRWNAYGMRGSFDLSAFTGKDEDQQFAYQTANLLNICVPQAITASRPANCTNAVLGGQPGVLITHSAATTIVNAGKLTLRGFEAAATVSPIESLTIGAGVGHVEGKVRSVNIPPKLQALSIAAGQLPTTALLLTQTPEWTYNVDVDYAYPEKVLNSDVSFNVNYKHSDKWISSNSGVYAPAYDVWDARLTFADFGGTGVDISAWVTNITNNTYLTAITSGSPSAQGLITGPLGQPRTYGITVRYDF